jgi:BlaI family penicillinase repressor
MAKKTKQPLPKLSDAEWDIIGAIWDHGPMAARDVFQHVTQNQDWAYKTVKTMLARLVKKGALDYDQIGNSYLYRAAYTREEMAQDATSSFIKRVFNGTLNPFFANFAEDASDEDIAQLRAELDRIEDERRKGDDN